MNVNVPAAEVALVALLAGAGYVWGAQVRAGVGGAGFGFSLALGAGLLAALTLLSLNGSELPVAAGALAYLGAACAAMFRRGGS